MSQKKVCLSGIIFQFFRVIHLSYVNLTVFSVISLYLLSQHVHFPLEWSFRSLFSVSRGIRSSPFAKESIVVVEKFTHPHARLSPPPSTSLIPGIGFLSLFNISEFGNDFFSWTLTLSSPLDRDLLPPFDETQYISIQRSSAGYDDESGKFVTRFRNLDSHNHVTVRLYELVPWYVHLYLHSLRFHFFSGGEGDYALSPLDSEYVNYRATEEEMSRWIVKHWAEPCVYNDGESIFPLPLSHPLPPSSSISSLFSPSPAPPPSSRILGNLLYIRLQPALNRISPAIIEFIAQISPNSTMEWTSAYDLALLSFYEYPPDAHRGFDVGSASIYFRFHGKKKDVFTKREYLTNAAKGLDWPKCVSFIKENVAEEGSSPWIDCIQQLSEPHLVHTDMVRVTLPTPDFSMPYNVIVFTCTILGIFFGQMLNALLTRLTPLKEGKEVPSSRLITILLNYLLERLFWKREESQEGTDEKVNQE